MCSNCRRAPRLNTNLVDGGYEEVSSGTAPALAAPILMRFY